MGRKIGSKNKTVNKTVNKSVNKNKNIININVNSTTKRKKNSGNSKNNTNNSVGRPAGGGGVTSNYGRQSVQPFIIPASIPQQVQPQSIGDSTALNMLMSSIIHRDQEYKNKLDSSMFTPQHAPPSRIEIQTVDTANTMHETSTIKPPKPRAIKNIVDEIQPVIQPEIQTAIKLPPTKLNFDTPKETMNEKPKTSILKRLLGLGRKKTPSKEEAKLFQQDTPSPEERKLLEYKPSPVISSSKPPTQLMSDLIFGPAKEEQAARQAPTAPHAISTQTSEAQTEQLTHLHIQGGIRGTINKIRMENPNVQLGYAVFMNRIKPGLEELHIPPNLRDYKTYYGMYKQMNAANRLDLGHNSGIILP
jgi:hypothetical protein